MTTLREHFRGTQRPLAPIKNADELRTLQNSLLGSAEALRDEIVAKSYIDLSARPIPIDDVREADSTRDPFVSAFEHVIVALQGRNADQYAGITARVGASQRGVRIVRNLVAWLMKSRQPTVILGDPGSGKTMTLQKAFVEIANEAQRSPAPRFPVYLRLGDFNPGDPVVTNDVIWEFVRSSMQVSVRPYFEQWRLDGRFILIFDGMDEMSRDPAAYRRNVEALSKFATEVCTYTTTLFSCRINDFSPRFRHKKLVLLPLNKKQIAQYLDKEIGDRFPVRIRDEDGAFHCWKSSKELAITLLSGDLPFEGDNAFILWLLCQFVKDPESGGKWPESRVELLRFYSERNFERKLQEQTNVRSFAGGLHRAATLRIWSHIAYLITERNAGSSITVESLMHEIDAADLASALYAGKICGVLRIAHSGSIGEYDTAQASVKFAHHRFQEYFAADYIHQIRPTIRWEEKLRIPRWQETISNLVLTGDASLVIDPLIAALKAGLEIVSERASASNTEDLRDLRQDDEQETALAELVELTSRILRQGGHSPQDTRKKLLGPFVQSVGLLAEKGNPITQVKMLYACKNVPDLDPIEEMKGILASPIAWVNDQATALMAGDTSVARAIGSNLPTEIGLDLARGSFLLRAVAYARSAAKSGKASFRATVALASLLSITILGASLVEAIATFNVHTSFANRFEDLWAMPFVFPIYCAIAILTLLSGLTIYRRLLHVGILATGLSFLLLQCAQIVYAGIGNDPEIANMGTAFVYLSVVGMFCSQAYFVLALLHYSGLLAYFGWVKLLQVRSLSLFTLLKTSRDSHNHRPHLLAGQVWLWIILRELYFGEHHSRPHVAPTDRGAGQTSTSDPGQQVSSHQGNGISPPSPQPEWMTKGITYLTIAAVAVIAVVLLYPMLRTIYREFVLKRRWSFEGEKEWLDSFKSANNSDRQFGLIHALRRASSIKPERRAELLEEVRHALRGDPAASTYWSYLNELRDIQRQERLG